MKYAQCQDYCMESFSEDSQLGLWFKCSNKCYGEQTAPKTDECSADPLQDLPRLARALSTAAPTTATAFDATKTDQLGSLGKHFITTKHSAGC